MHSQRVQSRRRGWTARSHTRWATYQTACELSQAEADEVALRLHNRRFVTCAARWARPSNSFSVDSSLREAEGTPSMRRHWGGGSIARSRHFVSVCVVLQELRGNAIEPRICISLQQASQLLARLWIFNPAEVRLRRQLPLYERHLSMLQGSLAVRSLHMNCCYPVEPVQWFGCGPLPCRLHADGGPAQPLSRRCGGW